MLKEKWVCPRCKGSGEEKIDKIFAVVTFGISAIVDSYFPEDCSRCDGSGFVKE